MQNEVKFPNLLAHFFSDELKTNSVKLYLKSHNPPYFTSGIQPSSHISFNEMDYITIVLGVFFKQNVNAKVNVHLGSIHQGIFSWILFLPRHQGIFSWILFLPRPKYMI